MSKRLTSLGVESIRPGSQRKEISDGGSGLWLVVHSSGHSPPYGESPDKVIREQRR
jgi:hypothetical protein